MILRRRHTIVVEFETTLTTMHHIHAQDAMVRAVTELAPDLDRRGIRIVSVSRLTKSFVKGSDAQIQG